jgi:hypothetical protein
LRLLFTVHVVVEHACNEVDLRYDFVHGCCLAGDI